MSSFCLGPTRNADRSSSFGRAGKMSNGVLARSCAASMTGHQVAQPQRNRGTNRCGATGATCSVDLHEPHARVDGVSASARAALGLACAQPAHDERRGDGGQGCRSGRRDRTCTGACASKGQACSLGRCTSTACQDAEASPQKIAGCVFYTLQADNVTADEGATTSFLVANAGVDPANVQLEVAQARSDGTTWVAMGDADRRRKLGQSAISGHRVTAVGSHSPSGAPDLQRPARDRVRDRERRCRHRGDQQRRHDGPPAAVAERGTPGRHLSAGGDHRRSDDRRRPWRRRAA